MPNVRKVDPNEALSWEAEGVKAGEELPSAESARRRAMEQFRERHAIEQRKQRQRLIFDTPYLMLVCLGDQHLGGEGTDVERCFAEAEQAARMPNTIIALLGDLTDNFVVPKLAHVRNTNRLALTDEQVLMDAYIERCGPTLALSVGGNHDHWTQQMAGVPYFQRTLAKINPNALYDDHDLKVTLTLRHAGMEVDFPGRLRHKWRGSVASNLSGPIEKAHHWEHDFLWGVGAHVHASGAVRQFNAGGGRTATAAMVGTYKLYDEFPKALGLPAANSGTAVALLFDWRSGSVLGFNNLDLAERVIRSLTGIWEGYDAHE